MPRPYYGCIYNNNNPVHMVWHDYICFQPQVWKMIRNFTPNCLGNFPKFIQLHFPLNNLSKQTLTLIRHRRDEIRPRLGIIISRYTDGAAVVFIGIEFGWHGCYIVE